MAKTKYYTELNDSERSMLTQLICENSVSERTIMRAKILLMSDTTQQDKVSIRELAEKLGTTETTIKTVRTEYVTQGLDAALYRKKRSVPNYKRRIDDMVAEQIRDLAASQPPAGHKRWSSRLIAEEAMKRGIVDHITSSTVCKIISGKPPYLFSIENK